MGEVADVEGTFTGVLHPDSQRCYPVQRFMACTVVVVIYSMCFILCVLYNLYHTLWLSLSFLLTAKL